jgi:hypothetical protein
VKKTPLQIVKERFGEKAKLIEALGQFTSEDLWVNRLNAEKGLEHVSNAKLIRLFDTFSAVKEKFGNRGKLIDSILEIEKRTKDTGYRGRLDRYPVPRLYDMYRSASRRQTKAARPARRSKAGAAAGTEAAPKAKSAKPRATKKAKS